MPQRPTDDELRAALRDLPLPDPPPEFAGTVMARVRSEHRKRRFRPWLLAAAAAALVATALVARSGRDGFSGGGGESASVARTAAPPTPERLGPERLGPERLEFEAIAEEYRLLAEEIEAMRRFAGEPPFGPLVRIGGSGQVDLFLDIESYLDRPAGSAGPPAFVPVSDRRPRR